MNLGNLMQVEQRLAFKKSEYEKAAGQKELLERQRTERAGQLERTKTDVQVWQQVQILFTKTSEFAREQLRKKIQDTVTAALQSVFEKDGLSFEIELKTMNGNPAASWQVVSMYGDTAICGDPESSRGGGISDVVSLALRLSLLELSRPKPLGPVLLDEVGKHVSKEYSPNVAEFLRQYARTTGRQVLLITHQADLADSAHTSYQVAQHDGISEVERIG